MVAEKAAEYASRGRGPELLAELEPRLAGATPAERRGVRKLLGLKPTKEGKRDGKGQGTKG